MESYVLSCCSTVDISKEWAEKRNILLAYFRFYLNDEEYRDDFYTSLPQEQLFERMLKGEKSRTSQVNSEEYMELFRPALEAGKDIVHFCLSSGISGTRNSCQIAKDILLEEFPERKIEIIDSLSASVGYGLLVDKAADLRDEGLSLEALVEKILEYRSLLQGYFFTSDLRFFIQGGRISKAAGFIGGLLNICPIIMITEEGTLKPIEKARGKKQAFNNLLSKMEKKGYMEEEKVFLCHSACPEDVETLKQEILKRYPKAKIDTFVIGGTIACHTGPGTVACFFFGREGR